MDRKICQTQIHRAKELVYIIYTNRPLYYRPNMPKVDCAGIFTNKQDAKKIANCINNIFRHIKDPIYKLETEYQTDEIQCDNKLVYAVIGKYSIKNKLYLNRVKREEIGGVTKSLKKANQLLKELENYNNHKYLVKEYYLNDVMPTVDFEDYDLEKHQDNMKIITDELQKYPQRKKMRDVLENIELLKHAPPSRVLPKGGIEYREMVNDPEFRQRWSKYDKKFE